MDRRRILAEERPFSCAPAADGKVRVAYRGKQVATLAGKEAAKARSLIDSGDAAALQLYLAKATGNFKRGNERR